MNNHRFATNMIEEDDDWFEAQTDPVTGVKYPNVDYILKSTRFKDDNHSVYLVSHWVQPPTNPSPPVPKN